MLWLVLVAMFLPACRTQDFRTEGDALRARLMEMEREVERLERRNLELEAQVRRTQRPAHNGDVEEGVAEHTPHVVDIALARFSHARDVSGDGMPDELRLYLHTQDGRGRFVQAVGELTIRATILPEDPAKEPLMIGTRTLNPGEMRDAYRSGFMGTHYTVTMPIELPAELASLSETDVQSVFVRATFRDGLTGTTHTAERVLELRR